jgi:hypothetical protein
MENWNGNWKGDYIQCPHCGDWTDPTYSQCMCCGGELREELKYNTDFFSKLTNNDIEHLLFLVGNFQCTEADIIHAMLQDLNGIMPIIRKYLEKHPLF